ERRHGFAGLSGEQDLGVLVSRLLLKVLLQSGEKLGAFLEPPGHVFVVKSLVAFIRCDQGLLVRSLRRFIARMILFEALDGRFRKAHRKMVRTRPEPRSGKVG